MVGVYSDGLRFFSRICGAFQREKCQTCFVSRILLIVPLQLAIVYLEEHIQRELIMAIHKLLCNNQARRGIREVKVVLNINIFMVSFTEVVKAEIAVISDRVILQEVIEHLQSV